MKSKVICKGVTTLPESKDPGARVYHNATFKRVGLTRKADAETERAINEHPSVRAEFATWGPEPSPFVPGKEYTIEIKEYTES